MHSLGRRPRTISQVEAERRNVLDLHLAGLNQAAIAERLDIHQSTVSRELAQVEKAWYRHAVDDSTAEGREIVVVRRQLRSAWAAWQQSHHPVCVRVIHSCLEQEAALLGLRVAPEWLLERELVLAVAHAGMDPAKVRRRARRMYRTRSIELTSVTRRAEGIS